MGFDYDYDCVYDYSFAFDCDYAYDNRKGPLKQSLIVLYKFYLR
jgi:hypothetical protein